MYGCIIIIIIIIIIIFIIIRSNHSRQHSKRYIAGVQEKRKAEKHRKVEMKRKWLTPAELPYYL